MVHLTFQVFSTVFGDLGDTSIMAVNTGALLFQDCQFYSHTAIFISSDVHGVSPEVRFADCFLNQTTGNYFYMFEWVINSNLEVLLRIWNITIYENGKYYRSVSEDFENVKAVRGNIDVLDSFFASGNEIFK